MGIGGPRSVEVPEAIGRRPRSLAPMAEERSTVVLADDHAVVRTGLRMLLERDGTMEVVAEASDGDAVLRYVRGHKPDVVVLDLNMPGRDSLEAIPDILETSPSTRVVTRSMRS